MRLANRLPSPLPLPVLSRVDLNRFEIIVEQPNRVGTGCVVEAFQKWLSQPQRLAELIFFPHPNFPCWIGGFLPQGCRL